MIKFPIRMIYSKELVEHAVNQLGCKVMQISTHPIFMFISESGGIYVKDNAIEFGVSGYIFVEQKDFLKEELAPTLKNTYVYLSPKDKFGASLFFKVQKSNYNYIYDNSGKIHYKGDYDMKVLNKNQIKILRDLGILV